MFQGFFKFVFGLLRLVFFLAIFVLIFHTWVIRQVLTFSLSYQLGADVSIQSVKMDWKNTGFEIQGLEIGNPYSFPKGTLADIPLVIVSVDLPEISKGALRLKTVGIDLRGLQIMNVPQKGLNVLEFKPLKKSNEGRPLSSQEAVQAQVKKITPELMIDELIFSIGDINYVDASGPALKQHHYQADIRGATYYNLRGAQDVIAVVIGEALKKMNFAYLGVQIQKFRSSSVSAGAGKKSGFLDHVMDALN
jgi:hypothetical protein